MTKRTKEQAAVADKHIEEERFDTNRRAKDSIDYEQMLFAFIENEFKGVNE